MKRISEKQKVHFIVHLEIEKPSKIKPICFSFVNKSTLFTKLKQAFFG